MSERPALVFGGRHYQRRNGKWLDGSLAVPLILSQKLDATAKEDPVFWDRCMQQDFDDDPRKRGIRISPLDPTFADLFVNASSNEAPTPIPGYQSSGRGRGPRRQYGLESELKKDRRLLLTCDIEQGWRQTERTWCFRASNTTPLPSEIDIRATVAILEDTWGQSRRQITVDLSGSMEASESYASIESVAPRFPRIERTSHAIQCVLDRDHCTLLLVLYDARGQLNDALPWDPSGNRDRLSWSEYGFFERPFNLHGGGTCVSRPFRIELDARFHDRSIPGFE